MNRPRTSGRSSIAFLLTQIGAEAASQFAGRLAPLHLLPQQAGVLRILGQSEGISQQELAARLEMHASRLVGVVDTLEKRGLVARESSATDRRVYALHLTEKGRRALTELGAVAREHDNAICDGLSAPERAQFFQLLERVAERMGLAHAVHPGYRTLEQRENSQPS